MASRELSQTARAVTRRQSQPLGPWEARPRSASFFATVRTATGYAIAVVRGGDRSARLMAAAPDLLEACQDAAKTFRQYEALHAAKGTVDGAQKAAANASKAKRCEAAIAKAEGRS